MEAMLKTFGLLSDETRIRILKVVCATECCVCEVMKALDITQSTASRGLTALYDAGFLNLRKEGLWSLYSIKKENIPPYRSQLVDIITRELKDNQVIVQDRERLKEAKRTSPRHIQSRCKCQMKEK